ncbi:glycosyltransferase [Bdellovibrio sp. HCB2-146]|uniref:glycosyltransferase n=1 Tax=Bdellovibrio sp. HCB2-146 TaxID=3394362 RepID=UPI0039BD06FE
MQRAQLTIGVVVHNEVQHLPRLLQNLENIVGAHEADIIFVDNASTDSTLARIEHWSAQQENRNIQIIARLRNNLALARNDVIHKTQTKWLFFWDADCGMNRDSWERHLEILQSNVIHENVAAIGGGNSAQGPKSFLVSGLQSMSRNWISHMGSLQLRHPSKVEEVSVLSGCNMLIRTQAAIQVDGCDSWFHPVGEDLSLCHRLTKAGWVLLAAPNLEIDHYQNQTVISWMEKMFAYGLAQVQIATQYPQHFKGLRGAQCLAVILLAFASVLTPLLVLSLFAIYTLAYVTLAVKNGPRSIHYIFCGWALSFLSHLAYATGEVYALTSWLYCKFSPTYQGRSRIVKEQKTTQALVPDPIVNHEISP